MKIFQLKICHFERENQIKNQTQFKTMNDNDKEKARREQELSKKPKSMRNKRYKDNQRKKQNDPVLEERHQKKLKIAREEA